MLCRFIFVFGVFILFTLPTASADLVEFIFRNQAICGNPFSDAQWVPVLDTCEIECEPDKELCVEDDSLTQRCNKLPDQCITEWTTRQQKTTTTTVATRRTLSRARPLAPNQALQSLPETLTNQIQGTRRFAMHKNFL